MARYISFAVLLGIIVVIGALFYKVMIGFFVPVFLAAVLVVVFRPLHRWVGSKVGERDHVAAGITTTLILLSVLIPASLVLTMAAIQGAGFVKDFNFSSIQYGLAKLRTNDWVNLEYPHAPIVREIQSKVEDIQKEATEQRLEELLNPKGKLQGDIKEIRKRLPDLIPSLTKQSIVEMERKFNSKRKKKDVELVVRSDLEKILEQANEQLKEVFADVPPTTEAVEMDPTEREVLKLKNRDEQLVNAKLQPVPSLLPSLPSSEDSKAELEETKKARDIFLDTAVSWNNSIDNLNRALDKLQEGKPDQPEDVVEFQKAVFLLNQEWTKVRDTLSGGAWIGMLKTIANPSPEEVKSITESVIDYIRPRLLSFTGDSAAFLFRLVIGTVILLVSLYFFLCDGPVMVRSMMELSPLDDRYELELLAEFDRISRAIVLATVLSALAQGLTAGIAYYFVGMPSLVMLVSLTCICALVPFVGPSLVWVPVAIYLAVFQENIVAAIGMAFWGIVVVANVDNVIKILVLHGQSQLHPLLALLSVLGGIQALGPIGILVGPMVVVLLQTLLGILRHELAKFKKQEDSTSPVTNDEIRDFGRVLRKPKVVEEPMKDETKLTNPGSITPEAST
jgi:predicted PurR-regulated permease PerM